MVKQRNESCEVYKKAGRKELLEIEIREIEVISSFLPKQLMRKKPKKYVRRRLNLQEPPNERYGESYGSFEI